MKNFW